MATSVATSRARSSFRDPVLIVPAIVGAGLVVGWLGTGRGASGARIAADFGLSWALVAASLVALERVRWRRARILLVVAAFALLAADLRWTGSGALWTLAFVTGALWGAVLVQLVLTFPEGRPWSRAAQLTVACAYATSLGSQLLRAFALPDPRNVLLIVSGQSFADGVARAEAALGVLVSLTVLALVAGRLRLLRGPARRAQAPLHVAALAGGAATAGLLGWVVVDGTGSSTPETLTRVVALLAPLGIATGLLWSRLGRHEASELVVELRTAGSDSLRERLVRILGDPSLEVVYRLDDGRYVDSDGVPREVVEAPSRAITVVTAQGREVAALVHDPALLDEPGLVDSVRATAGLVLENERLAAEVRAQLAEVRASRARLVAATDAERRRLERNLHDGAQQRLVTLAVTLGLAAARGDTETAGMLSSAQDQVEQAIGELRELARGIHPTILREEGLDAAVAALARRAPIPVDTHGSAGERLPDAVELAAYFVVSEALTNVFKHAGAGEAWVQVERRPGLVAVSVTDDGRGGASPTADSGLAGLRDRVEALDGSLIVDSPHGRGTTIRAEIPCA